MKNTGEHLFPSVPLEEFSEWARTGDIASTQIVRVEHWKYRSSLAFWHEFVLVKISGTSRDISLPRFVTSGKLDATFRTLMHNGLAVRFDRRVLGDFAEFVTSDDEAAIASSGDLIQTVIFPATDEGSDDDSLERSPYLRPCLRDIVFFFGMFTDNAPGYHLLSRNCYTFAWCIIGLLHDIFRVDIIIERGPRRLWRSTQTQKLLRPARLTPKLLNNEAFAMAGYVHHHLLKLQATLAPGSEYTERLIAESVPQNEDDEYHRRLKKRYRPEGESKVTALD
ncbi:hypothetical protein BS47DRAFT_292597 [Hydnum rufescens UP504]|uniref:PPPDE domain-containing protein n=1 Tax=Hydnum rufescens UP504 TaxID=1448309 RepID=A0A9P6E0W4_9AGAM|nr:hypothetical protein BS47DRAFT_292597 [Hydnum rufescens UP504]